MQPLFRIGSLSRRAKIVQGLASASLVVGVLGAAGACGSPGELDQDLFPREYTDNSVAAAGSPTVLPDNAGGMAGMAMGAAGAPAMPQAGAGGSMDVIPDPMVPGCDAPSLFQRPVAEGGCTSGAGAGCHEGGENTTSPDLVSPGIAARLMASNSIADRCTDLPLIGDGVETSYLFSKIEKDGSPQCGVQMPFLSAGNLSDDDRQCIVDWITAISGGG